jgi:hypothetical protein
MVCGIVRQTIAVLGAPKLPPNGDGYNDYWNVKGEYGFNANS